MDTLAPDTATDAGSPGYPLRTRTATGLVKGESTNVTVHHFTEKILVTITQRGRLGQWVLCLDVDFLSWNEPSNHHALGSCPT